MDSLELLSKCFAASGGGSSSQPRLDLNGLKHYEEVGKSLEAVGKPFLSHDTRQTILHLHMKHLAALHGQLAALSRESKLPSDEGRAAEHEAAAAHYIGLSKKIGHKRRDGSGLMDLDYPHPNY